MNELSIYFSSYYKKDRTYTDRLNKDKIEDYCRKQMNQEERSLPAAFLELLPAATETRIIAANALGFGCQCHPFSLCHLTT